MLKLAGESKKILEIGCGPAQTSLCLAMQNNDCTALDFSEDMLQAASKAAEILQVRLSTVLHDATMPLPFQEKEFDIIFHAGLMEHFTKQERIKMLRMWRPYCKRMISMAPNAASIAYRFGKAIMEKNGTWPYGLETTLYTQIDEFIDAGYCFNSEYTIGKMNSLNFLPNNNWFKKAMVKLWEEDILTDDCHQGYLLVTIGENISQ
jgi:2-polyprenyl-3-methyl-5-hydroxy-6-metoxy-1,4-benzoquinol methylase